MADRNNVISLAAAVTFTPEQALKSALDFANEVGLSEVLVIGYDTDGDLFIRSSRMERKDALWMAEYAKLHAMDRL